MNSSNLYYITIKVFLLAMPIPNDASHTLLSWIKRNKIAEINIQIEWAAHFRR